MQRNDEIKAQIALAIQHLESAIELIGEVDVGELPLQAKERLEKKLCLQCGKPLAKAKKVVRGCCESCYKRVTGAVDDGKLTMDEAIAQGMITSPATSGRKRKRAAIDDLLDRKKAEKYVDKVIEKANDAEGKPKRKSK